MSIMRRSKPEAIDVRSLRFGYFPSVWMWRGHEYRVEAVEKCWTSGRATMTQHHFKVRCSEGVFNLYQNIQHNTWHIQP